MRSLPLLRFSCVALFVTLGCDKEAPKPDPLPATPPPTVSEVAKPVADVPPTPPPPAAPVAQPAPPDVGGAPKDAAVTKSGLASKVLTKGTGKVRPTATDQVRIHYAGWTKDGQMFDASRPDKTTAVPVGSVQPEGWAEGLKLMVAGEKRRLWIPAKLAFGERPMMPGAPAGDLVFDVELVEIVKPPETPKDLAKPPADATKTASGLVYKVLTKGKGKTHPGPTNTVSVHYSGWTKAGKLFDSSLAGGAPISFPLGNVIKGWTEGLELLVEGDKARLWIPAELAYGEKPAQATHPAGDLVFDVELIAVK